jgi:long-subunit acyl-CoA synthetase (AMP-forming)
VIGGAALDPWIHEFMMYALGCRLRIAYGASEPGSGNIVNAPDDAEQTKKLFVDDTRQ